MHVAGELALWLDAAFGLLLAISAAVTAEGLARIAEADTGRSQGARTHAGAGEPRLLAQS